MSNGNFKQAIFIGWILINSDKYSNVIFRATVYKKYT